MTHKFMEGSARAAYWDRTGGDVGEPEDDGASEYGAEDEGPPVLLEREQVLAAAERMFREALDGSGGVLIIVGPAGTGALDALPADVTGLGGLMLRSAANETERRLPVARLTQSEARVARLAAAGQSNQDIARTLYITVSTVEQHLTRVYRKLGVKNRSGLRRRLVDERTGRT